MYCTAFQITVSNNAHLLIISSGADDDYLSQLHYKHYFIISVVYLRINNFCCIGFTKIILTHANKYFF